jgi:AcrR family transcriptional regulator
VGFLHARPYDQRMAVARPEVTPNRRGARSREAVLDAAERVMAQQGYEGATINAIVKEAGIPISSVYHYFGSKDGVLLAVMERGAARFFAAIPRNEQRNGNADEHIRGVTRALVAALEEHPDFLRLLVAMAAQPPVSATDQTRAVIRRVREAALERLRIEIVLAFEPERPEQAEALAHVALAMIDGAFIASQADGIPLADLTDHLPTTLAAVAQSAR